MINVGDKWPPPHATLDSLLELLFYTENGGNMFHRNVDLLADFIIRGM
jgi:hypothetical protein